MLRRRIYLSWQFPALLFTRHRNYFTVAIILENEAINLIMCLAVGVDVYKRLCPLAFIYVHVENENKAHTFLQQLK